jgi:hypothetical protein
MKRGELGLYTFVIPRYTLLGGVFMNLTSVAETWLLDRHRGHGIRGGD